MKGHEFEVVVWRQSYLAVGDGFVCGYGALAEIGEWNAKILGGRGQGNIRRAYLAVPHTCPRRTGLVCHKKGIHLLHPNVKNVV
jgi:hypothetical protein